MCVAPQLKNKSGSRHLQVRNLGRWQKTSSVAIFTHPALEIAGLRSQPDLRLVCSTFRNQTPGPLASCLLGGPGHRRPQQMSGGKLFFLQFLGGITAEAKFILQMSAVESPLQSPRPCYSAPCVVDLFSLEPLLLDSGHSLETPSSLASSPALVCNCQGSSVRLRPDFIAPPSPVGADPSVKFPPSRVELIILMFNNRVVQYKKVKYSLFIIE